MLPAFSIPLDKILWILGSLGGLAYVFYRGWKSGRDGKELEQRRAEDQLRGDVRRAESENLKEDAKRDEKINAIDAVGTITELISLWNEKFGKKDSDKHPPKK